MLEFFYFTYEKIRIWKLFYNNKNGQNAFQYNSKIWKYISEWRLYKFFDKLKNNIIYFEFCIFNNIFDIYEKIRWQFGDWIKNDNDFRSFFMYFKWAIYFDNNIFTKLT